MEDPARVIIDRDPSFGVQLPERDTYRPLVLAEFAQGIGRELKAFADTHAGGPEKQQSLGAQGLPFVETALQFLVILGREGLGKVQVARGIISGREQVCSRRIAARLQIPQQAADIDDSVNAGFVGQRRFPFMQAAEPAENMRIAAELGRSADLGQFDRR